MGRFIKVELSDDQRKELENGYRNGKTHAFRLRCQMVLLKSEGRKSQDIADFLGSSASKRSTTGSSGIKRAVSMDC